MAYGLGMTKTAALAIEWRVQAMDPFGIWRDTDVPPTTDRRRAAEEARRIESQTHGVCLVGTADGVEVIEGIDA